MPPRLSAPAGRPSPVLTLRLAEQLLDETTDLVCTTEEDGRIGYVNRAFERALGYPAVEAAALRLVDLVAPEHQGRYLDAARRLTAGETVGASDALDVVLVARDGRRLVCRGQAAADLARGPDGVRCLGTRIVLRDVSAEWDAATARARLLATFEATTDFVGTTRPDGRVDYLNRAGRRLLGLPADADLTGRMAADFHPPATLEQLQRVAMPAVVRHGAWVGEGALRREDGEEVPVSMAVVAHPSLVPGEPPYFSAIMRDLRDVRRADEALRATEARFRAIFDHATVGVSVVDPAGTIVEANAAFHAFLGHAPGTLVGVHAPSLSPPQDADVTRGPVADLRAGRAAEVTVQKRFIRCDGSVRWASLTMALMPLADGTTGVLGMTVDITARREAEAALRESEARLGLIYNSASDLMFLLRVEPGADGRPAYRCESVNEAYLAVTGLPREALVGRTLGEVLGADGAAAAAERYDLAAATGDVLRYDEEVELPTGRVVVETTLTPILDADGACTHLLGASRDVTARRRAEAALRASEARVRGAVEASQDALVIYGAVRDAAGEVVDFLVEDCNARACALFDRPREALIGQRLLVLAPLLRETGLFDAYRHVLDTGEAYDTEYEPVDPRTRAGWLKLHVVRLGDGLSATMRDISEQKHVEETLRGLALVDELTGVHNRRGFMALAEREWQRARREERGVVLAYVDLDAFKAINDTYGHAEGDRALRAATEVLRGAFRGADIVGRLGGDEFVVLAVGGGVGGGDASDASVMEQALRARLAAQLVAANVAARAAGRPYDLAMSVGSVSVSGRPAAGVESLAALMVAADERLYEVKRGRPALAGA